MFRKSALALTLLILLPVFLFAQEGKLRGKITDKESGEPLIGANVQIEGMTLGASSDVDGNYVILSVPVGTYTLKVTYVGYSPIEESNVRVNSNLSTILDFKLSSTAVQVKPVEIVAERPLVNKSATSSIRIVDQDFIANLPQRGINASISLQPGVVQIGNNFYIRGGRYDETAFTLEGAPITDIVNGGRAVTIIDESLEQVQVLAGGYGAEFGGADGGIIRSQLRTGGQNYAASLRVESDDYTGQGSKSLGGYSYGYRDLTATVGGPLGMEKTNFFLSYQNTYYKDPSTRLWDGFNFPNQLTVAQLTPAHPTALGIDTINVVYPAGNLIGGYDQANNFAGSLGADLGGMQVRLGGSYSYDKSQNQATLATLLDQSRLGINENQNGFANLKVTQFLDQSTYYELNVNYTLRAYKSYDPAFGDNLFAYGDSTANAAHGYTLSATGIPFNPYFIALGDNKNVIGAQSGLGYIGGIDQYGTPIAGYTKGRAESIGGRFDLTTQLRSSTELKLGGEYTRYTYRRFNPGFTTPVYQWALFQNLTGDALYKKLLALHPDNIGYDVFGNEISSNVYDSDGQLTDMAPRHPTFGAAYAQSKIELADVIINAGLRYDYIDGDGQTLLNPNNIKKDSTGHTDLLATNQLLSTDKYQFVTPRLGFSFPASDRTVFHAGYGKYVQYPRLADAYLGLGAASQIVGGGNFFVNTTGYGLRPERTTQYEIGFQQQLSDYAALDITGFYKDIIDQLQYAQILPAPGASSGAFPMYVNGDFATSKGLEMKFTLRRVSHVQVSANYTLSDAEGTGSSATTLAGAVVASGIANYIPKYVFPNTFNEPHRGNVSVDYRYGKDEGGALEQAGINLLMSFNSGTSFTQIYDTQEGTGDPRARTPVEPIGASSTGWVFQLDSKIDKGFQISGVNADIYIYVINLLGTKNTVTVFPKTGSPSEDGWLGSIQGQADVNGYGKDAALYQQMYRQILLGDNPNNYGPPRQIRFGVKLEL